LYTEHARLAAEHLTWQTKGSQATVKNDSPYYVSLSQVNDAAGKHLGSGGMLEPGGSTTINLERPVIAGEKLKYYYIDDFGAHIAVNMTP
jgi:P pilus assembly protein, chaperone PapD